MFVILSHFVSCFMVEIVYIQHTTVCFVFAGSCAIAFLWISLSFSNSKRKYCTRSGCVLQLVPVCHLCVDHYLLLSIIVILFLYIIFFLCSLYPDRVSGSTQRWTLWFVSVAVDVWVGPHLNFPLFFLSVLENLWSFEFGWNFGTTLNRNKTRTENLARHIRVSGKETHINWTKKKGSLK